MAPQKGGRFHAWSLREQKKLFEVWKSETDWPTRAGKMQQQFTDRRGRGFFSPHACQSEFDRIMTEPCPGHEPSATGHVGYSHKAVIEKWIEHLDQQIKDEDNKAAELGLVEVRKKTALIDRLWNGKRPFTEADIDELLREARLEDKKRSDQVQVDQVLNAYMIRIKEVLFEPVAKSDALEVLPPTKMSVESPKGAETVFRSPSPLHSPIKSPIRAVAESIREVLSPFRRNEQLVEAIEPDLETEEDENTEMDVDESADVSIAGGDVDEEEVEFTDHDEATASPEPPKSEPMVEEVKLKTPVKPKTPSPIKREAPSKTIPTPATASVSVSSSDPPKRGRGRPPSKSVRPVERVVMKEQLKEEPMDEEADKHDTRKKPTRVETRDDIHIEDSPAGRRGIRRGIVDSPLLVGRGGKKGRTDDGILTPETNDGRGRRPEIKESSVASDISVSVASSIADPQRVPGEPCSIHSQTELSIQGPLWAHTEKKERRLSISRKSARRSDASEDLTATHRDVPVQTGHVDFEKEDKVVVTWRTDEHPFVRTVAMDIIKKKEEEWSDEDDMCLSNLTKRIDNDDGDPLSPSSEDRRTTKAEAAASKRELTFVVDTDEWYAKALMDNHGFQEDDGLLATSSPSKRARKEERTRGDQNNRTKLILMNAVKNLLNHRHASVFAAPVSLSATKDYVAVRSRMDIQTLKIDVNNGAISTFAQLKHRIMLMFANCVMFNSTAHDYNIFAKEMAMDTVRELNNMGIAERKTSILNNINLSRRSKFGQPAADEPSTSSRTSSETPNPKNSFESEELGLSRKLFGRKSRTVEVRRLPK